MLDDLKNEDIVNINEVQKVNIQSDKKNLLASQKVDENKIQWNGNLLESK
jgi:hypothetical protein